MNIIIPYKKDIFDGIELKYSLRSIQKYLTGWSNVLIVGRPPDWYKGDFISPINHDGRKQFSIYNKLLVACELKNCSEDFVMFNDDHFLLRPLKTTEIKYWFNHTLKDELNRDLTARYRETVFRTFEMFQDGLNFDVHTPIVYNKTKFKELFKDRQDEICIKSFYCNSVPVESHFYQDMKFNQILTYEQIHEKIKDRLFFSTGTAAIKKPLLGVFDELYPVKSQWE